MHLDPLLGAPNPIPYHAILAIAAFVLGLIQLALPKGTRRHRAMGWVWVAMMAAVAASSFAISEIRTFGYFSYIHILSVVTLVALVVAVRAARRGAVRAHATTMIFLFLGALVIAGGFTFLPYRIMNDVVTGRRLAD